MAKAALTLDHVRNYCVADVRGMKWDKDAKDWKFEEFKA